MVAMFTMRPALCQLAALAICAAAAPGVEHQLVVLYTPPHQRHQTSWVATPATPSRMSWP